MKELLEISGAWEWQKGRGGQAALATVVEVEGSSYRRPGARLLVLPTGETLGSVSGGCLEADVMARACAVMETGRPELATYDTGRDDDIVFGVGLGCQGIIHILIERLSEEHDAALACASTLITGGRHGVLATVYRADNGSGSGVGTRLLLGSDGRRCGDDRLLPVAQRAMQTQRSFSSTVDLAAGQADVFLEYLRPPLPLVIFGAGHDAQPLVRLAKELGWRVTVTDSRPALATPARFPTADAVRVAPRDGPPADLPLTADAVVVLMTHSYLQDLALLREILPSPARYVGVLGPKRRTQRLLQEIQDAGPRLTQEQLSRVHGPVGLDIGSETPEQIALAIVAEIQAATAGRSGGFLREQDGPIYDTPR